MNVHIAGAKEQQEHQDTSADAGRIVMFLAVHDVEKGGGETSTSLSLFWFSVKLFVQHIKHDELYYKTRNRCLSTFTWTGKFL